MSTPSTTLRIVAEIRLSLLSLSFVIIWTPVLAQVAPGDKPVAPTPNTAMLTRIYVNTRTIPFQHRVGTNVPKFHMTCDENVPGSCIDFDNPQSGSQRPAGRYGTVGGSGGDFRMICGLSHLAFHDPIVYPGIAGASHLHAFWGNTTTDAKSNLMTFATVGDSTCDGGNLNRTGYWTPPWVYPCPMGSTDGCERSRDGEVQVPLASQFYYKMQGPTGQTLVDARWYPNGHRMITGDPSGTGEAPPGTSITCFHDDGSLSEERRRLPTPEEIGSAGCTGLRVLILFSSCWDGVNLDSPNHNSHMWSNNNPYDECPTEFHVRFPNMSMVIYTPIKHVADLAYLRLASDFPKSSGYPAGSTLHADRVEGFSDDPDPFGIGANQSLKSMILNNCNKAGVDCHTDLVGSPLRDGKWYTLDRALGY